MSDQNMYQSGEPIAQNVVLVPARIKRPFSTAKLIIGILSMVLFVFITFQSCAAGISNALEQSGETSGSAGFILATFMLVAGIVGVVTRNSAGRGAAITAGLFYVVGAIIGAVSVGSYSDLAIWAVVSGAFGLFYLITAFVRRAV